MRKSPSPDLHALVRALTKGDKRNLRLLAKVVVRGAPKRYLELFEALDAMPVCGEAGEAALAAAFGDQLPSLKHYLHGLVLRSLSHFDQSPGTALVLATVQARALLARGLDRQAVRLLDRAAAEAERLEEWGPLAEALALLGERLPPNEAEALALREQAARERERAERGLRALRRRVELALGTGTCPPGSAARADLAERVLADPLMRPCAAAPARAALARLRVRMALEEGTWSPAWREAAADAAALLGGGHPALVALAHERALLLALLAEARALGGDPAGARADLLAATAAAGRNRPAWIDALLAAAALVIEAAAGQAAPLAAMLDGLRDAAHAWLPRLQAREAEALCVALLRGCLLCGRHREALAWAREADAHTSAGTRHTLRVQARALAILALMDAGRHGQALADLAALRRLLYQRGAVGAQERFLIRAVRILCKALEAGEDGAAEAAHMLPRYERLLRDDPQARHADRALHFWAWLNGLAERRPACAFACEGHMRIDA